VKNSSNAPVEGPRPGPYSRKRRKVYLFKGEVREKGGGGGELIN